MRTRRNPRRPRGGGRSSGRARRHARAGDGQVVLRIARGRSGGRGQPVVASALTTSFSTTRSSATKSSPQRPSATATGKTGCGSGSTPVASPDRAKASTRLASGTRPGFEVFGPEEIASKLIDAAASKQYRDSPALAAVKLLVRCSARSPESSRGSRPLAYAHQPCSTPSRESSSGSASCSPASSCRPGRGPAGAAASPL